MNRVTFYQKKKLPRQAPALYFREGKRAEEASGTKATQPGMMFYRIPI